MNRELITSQDWRPRQRSEFTFKANLKSGRHGWLRLTPAYSVKIVSEQLARGPRPLNILDPFSGTGTTALVAAMLGHRAVALEINPFLVWFGQAKVNQYDANTLAMTREYVRRIMEHLRKRKGPPAPPPPIYNIQRWWNPERLDFLCRLLAAINARPREPGPGRDLILIAFCRTMISLSNAAFVHQSMSFQTEPKFSPQMRLFSLPENEELENQFGSHLEFVLAGALDNPLELARVLPADSRKLPTVFEDGVDLLITSPPYPNRMSYIRELRPYMYWLGYLKKAPEAGELDWQAIGGTWGAATSRLSDWNKDPETFFPEYLIDLIEKIRGSETKSGDILSRYVARYFEDIWNHLCSASKAMKPGGEMRYIVGNSKFYDVLVPAELIYRDMLRKIGVSAVEVVPLRKRNSKKELYEYLVAAKI